MITHYHVELGKRESQQSNDYYYATVTRSTDEQQLVFTAPWKWLIKLRTRRWFLKREFKTYDNRQAKLAETESFTR